MERVDGVPTLLAMWLQRLDDWKLAHRLLRPMGTTILYMRPFNPAWYRAEKERRKVETRAEFRARGYTAEQIAEIESGDWFRVIAERKPRDRLRTA